MKQYHDINVRLDNLVEAATILATLTGCSFNMASEWLNNTIEKYELLKEGVEEITLRVVSPASEIEEMRASFEAMAYRLQEEALKMQEYFEVLVRDDDYRNVAPADYICPLHPRKDYQRQDYWLRIRSNPFRRNYH